MIYVFLFFVQAKALSSQSLSLPGNVDTREIKRAISFLMDNIGFVNTTGVFHVMYQVCNCSVPENISPQPPPPHTEGIRNSRG